MPKFENGDFVRNKIHNYISMLYKEYLYVELEVRNLNGWDALILETKGDWTSDFIKVGTLRGELSSEIEKVPVTLDLISTAKRYLDQINSVAVLDNLGYVEILNKLNEQEKAIKNENRL